ncbi:MAG: flagellin, partial [Planctomycetota bacterium]|nr:flagellin [Planctomycetota bacterium]
PEKDRFDAARLIDQIDNALKKLGKFTSRLDRDQKFLSSHTKLLQVRLSQTESMRSRFEDADVVRLQFENSQYDILRQATLASLARRQSDQQALVALLLGAR